MNKEMQNKLSQYIGTDSMLSFYYDLEDPESCYFGYPLQIDGQYVLVNIMDTTGEEDGFIIINVNDIFAFDDDEMYSKKMRKLFNIKKQQRRYICNLEADAASSLLKYATSNNLLIIVNDDDNFMGFVTEFTKETLTLKLIDNYGSYVGTAFIDMNNVNELCCQTTFLKTLQLVMQG